MIPFAAMDGRQSCGGHELATMPRGLFSVLTRVRENSAVLKNFTGRGKNPYPQTTNRMNSRRFETWSTDGDLTSTVS
jgi:hypothetical protein